MITNSLAIIALVLATILFVPMICRKIRIPSIVGFILVGVAVGQYGFGLLNDGSTAIQTLGKIGMLYIMAQAGIEVDVNDFRQQRGSALLFGLYSFAFPFLLGLVTSLLFGYGWVTSALLGAMYGSHTLMTYPIVSRYGVQKNGAANIAIGGTMLSITLSLLVLAVVRNQIEELGAQEDTWLIVGKMGLTLLVILMLFPWIAQRFFKRWSDPTSGFLIVMTMIVVSALLADWSGLEGILGAFVCGVALNRLVPNLSPVMQRINFVGNTIFVPLFLIGVGMMIDISLLWSGWATIIIAVMMIATKLAGKWLAAWLAQVSFNLQTVERQLIFGLTHATAAGTLAIVTIGFQTGIFDAKILNASVLMILVLCTSASFVTEYAAKLLALQEDARLESEKTNNEWLMMTVAENRHYELRELSELSELSEPEFASEEDWTEAVRLINGQSKASLVYHPTQPINTVNRLLVAVPRFAEKEHDFITCFGLIRRLSSQIGAKVVFYTNEDTQKALQAFCRRKGKFLRASYREMENWEDVLMIAKQMRPDDMVVMINARPSTPSYNPLFEQVPQMLDKFFSRHSYMLVYPEQETGAAIPDLLTGDTTQASKTWSVISAIKRGVLNLVARVQTMPTDKKA